MKKIFFALSLIIITLCSCQEEDVLKSNDIIGEWKATKIHATFNDGTTLTITDSKELEEQLDGLEWITINEHYIQIMQPAETSYHYQVLRLYVISDGYINFNDASDPATYYLQSVTDKEMVIKYTNRWTSLIYYTKVK